MGRMALLTWAVVLIVSGGASAQSSKPPSAERSAAKSESNRAKEGAKPSGLSEAEQGLLATVHRISQEEILAGDQARGRAESAQIKRYGERVAQDHRRMDSALLSLVKRRSGQLSDFERAGVDVQHAKRHQATMNRLSTLRGQDYDRAFLAAIIAEHEHALATIERAQTGIQDAQTRSLLDKMLPTVRQHLETARALSRSDTATPTPTPTNKAAPKRSS
jgi:putative membrane protein